MEPQHGIRLRGILFATILLLAISATPVGAAIKNGARIKALPSAADTGGTRLKASQLQGRVTVFVFFSIYSRGADELLEYFEKLEKNTHQKKPDIPMQIIAVSVDHSEAEVVSFAKKRRTTLRLFADTALVISNRFGVRDTPTVYVITPESVLRETYPMFAVSKSSALESLIDSITGAGGPADTPSPAARRADLGKMVSDSAKYAEANPVAATVLYISADGLLWKFDIARGKREALATGVTAARWSPDGKAIAFVTNDGALWLLGSSGHPVKIARSGHSPEWSPRGDMVAFVSGKDQIWVYSRTKDAQWRVAAKGGSVSWGGDGTFLLVTDARRNVWTVSPSHKETVINQILK